MHSAAFTPSGLAFSSSRAPGTRPYISQIGHRPGGTRPSSIWLSSASISAFSRRALMLAPLILSRPFQRRRMTFIFRARLRFSTRLRGNISRLHAAPAASLPSPDHQLVKSATNSRAHATRRQRQKLELRHFAVESISHYSLPPSKHFITIHAYLGACQRCRRYLLHVASIDYTILTYLRYYHVNAVISRHAAPSTGRISSPHRPHKTKHQHTGRRLSCISSTLLAWPLTLRFRAASALDACHARAAMPTPICRALRWRMSSMTTGAGADAMLRADIAAASHGAHTIIFDIDRRKRHDDKMRVAYFSLPRQLSRAHICAFRDYRPFRFFILHGSSQSRVDFMHRHGFTFGE